MLIFESTFPKNYRQQEIQQILNFVVTGKFCQLVCAPGVGKATILRLIAHNRPLLKFHLKERENSTRFIYLNFLELPSKSDEQIAKFLLLSLDQKPKTSNDPLVTIKQLNEAVNNLAEQGISVVFLFDHFDEYQNELPRSFFQMIKGINSLARYKFASVFATRRDLKELVDPEILKDFYDFFVGNTVYLKIYNKEALNLMFSQIEEIFKKKIPKKDKNTIVNLTGGHTKLTKVLAETRLRENIPLGKDALLKTPIIRATLFELWLFLTAHEQRLLTELTKKKSLDMENALENLIKFDLISKDLHFTIPLFEEFVRTTIPNVAPEKITYDQATKDIKKGTSVISDLLSPQEYRLLKFLIENQKRVVDRQEIIQAVWPDAQVLEGISDEAIDQMIFRLRKKIEDEPNSPKYLITIKGRGLRFEQ